MTNADKNPCPHVSAFGDLCTRMKHTEGLCESRTDWGAPQVAVWSNTSGEVFLSPGVDIPELLATRPKDEEGRFCPACDADLIGNDPHAEGCPQDVQPYSDMDFCNCCGMHGTELLPGLGMCVDAAACSYRFGITARHDEGPDADSWFGFAWNGETVLADA